MPRGEHEIITLKDLPFHIKVATWQDAALKASETTDWGNFPVKLTKSLYVRKQQSSLA
jgi:hypothetical protein